MPWIAAAGAVVAGALGANASKDAADASADATKAGIAENSRQFNIIRNDTAPGRAVGKSALYELADIFGLSSPEARRKQSEIHGLNNQLDSINEKIKAWEDLSNSRNKGGNKLLGGSLLPLDPSGGKLTLGGGGGSRGLSEEEKAHLDNWYQKRSEIESQIKQAKSQHIGHSERPGLYDNLEMDPGYDFRLAEGEKALQRQESAGGTRYGGAALKAAARYGQDYASNEFSNAVNRRNAELGYLFSLAGFGQQGIATAGQAGMNAASNNSNILMQNAANQGSYGIQGASAINNSIQGGLQNYYTQSLLKNYNQLPSGTQTSTSTNYGTWS